MRYTQYAHHLKYIDQEYCRNREKWATRNEYIELLRLLDYDERIFWLCKDAGKSYVFGIPKSVIMHSILAAEQILKSLYLLQKQYSDEAYELIEESKKGKGLTFGQLINESYKIDKLKSILPYFDQLNSIRNTSAAHMKFVINKIWFCQKLS